MEKEQLSKKEMKRRKRRRALIAKSVVLGVLLAILGVCIFFLAKSLKEDQSQTGQQEAITTPEPTPEATPEPSAEPVITEPQEDEKARALEEADYLALTYDYDGAMERLRQVAGYENDTEIAAKIAEYQATKDSCVTVNPNEVTHIFYHSLIVDPERGFAGDDSLSAGFKQWMTTVYEFNQITQKMYENGYVLVRMRDLVTQTTDEDGTVHFAPNQELKLPPGKKAFVMSFDDLSYYHSYDGRGIASKLILDENGEPTCEYIQPDGTMAVGDYDYVPILDKFIAEHPDASYKGAKAMVALTGYNGILGYRTDIAYKTGENLTADQEAWLAAHPDFNWDQEREEAKKVADAMKENGWEFASHTWGHLRVRDASYERLQRDTEKWMENVAPLVGGTDTIIFAHGQDLGKWGDYDESNEKFQYLREQGFDIFCNVDASQYATWLGDDYLRQGRRNLDGYRIYYNAIGEQHNVSDLFDASEILDPERPPVPAL